MTPGGLVYKRPCVGECRLPTSRSRQASPVFLPKSLNFEAEEGRFLFPGLCEVPEFLQAVHLDRGPVQLLEAVPVADGRKAIGQRVGRAHGKANFQHVADAFPKPLLEALLPAFLPALLEAFLFPFPGEESAEG